MRRGFTLIELLVVIAIIGLLSSIVLAALTTARYQAADAALQESSHELQTEYQIYYQDHGNYGPNPAGAIGCVVLYECDSSFLPIWNQIAANTAPPLPGTSGPSNYYLVSGATQQTGGVVMSYVLLVGMHPTIGENDAAWCTDSTGNAKYEINFADVSDAFNSITNVNVPTEVDVSCK